MGGQGFASANTLCRDHYVFLNIPDIWVGMLRMTYKGFDGPALTSSVFSGMSSSATYMSVFEFQGTVNIG